MHSLRDTPVHACTLMHLLANKLGGSEVCTTYRSYSCAQHHPSRVVTYSNQISTTHSAVGTQVSFRVGPLITHYTYVYSTRTRLNLSVLIRMHDPQEEYVFRANFQIPSFIICSLSFPPCRFSDPLMAFTSFLPI